MKTSVLKPGFLVSLKTSLKGGVHYSRVDTDPEHTDEDGARVATWSTTREVPDPQGFEAAQTVRNKARATVAAVCYPTSFGLLCPTTKETELDQAIATARALATAHNATSSASRVEVYVIVGRIAQDDAEAARAIGAEIRDLLEQMQRGIKAADATAIRDAATRAKNLGGMLSAEVSGQVSAAILEARLAARRITARVEKAGEAAAAVVAECSTARIESARFAFLDLDDNGQPVEPEEPAARGIDLEPTPTPTLRADSGVLPFALEV